jgi:hypothetical protein
MSVLVYQAINAIASDLAEGGIAKGHRNQQADYQYRSIEDVLNTLAPLLAKHKLCVLPRILERTDSLHGNAEPMTHVAVRAAFDLVSSLDGSTHTVESYGEALDVSDKATAKAISAAYKSAMLQSFCIPVPQEDADSHSPRLGRNLLFAEPPEGWENWSREVIDIAQSCQSREAVERLQAPRRQILAALQRARPDLYASVGKVIASKVNELGPPAHAEQTPAAPKRAKPKQKKGVADASCETAEAA